MNEMRRGLKEQQGDVGIVIPLSQTASQDRHSVRLVYVDRQRSCRVMT